MVESWTRLATGTQAKLTAEEDALAQHVAKSDPQVQERCREMGWTNMSLVEGSAWLLAYTEDRLILKNAVRPLQVFMYGRLFDGDNQYGHPFDFLVYVDAALNKVIGIDNLPTHASYDANNRNGNVCTKEPSNYDPELKLANFLRTDLHPIRFNQPQGVSFKIRGNELTWQRFKIRVGFNAREGVVIHHVSYQDGDLRRPLFYRMSIAELFVPYADPRSPFHQKIPFDMGQSGLGVVATDHKLTGICRGGEVAYMEIKLHYENGTIRTLPNAVCIHEENAGILWAKQGRGARLVHARSQRLTITCYSVMGNYDYRFSWRFYQDASIEFNAELHGILSAQLLAVNETSAGGFGSKIFPLLSAQYHQHNMALRIDPILNGVKNSVSTLDMVPLPDRSGSSTNPYGQGWTSVERVLGTPANARTRISPFTGRTWLIRNPTRIHPFTKTPVSWKLIPYNTGPISFFKNDSPLHQKAAFLDYSVWVTKYKEGQMYPAGFYINGTGLVDWVKEKPDEDIRAEDIVLWYNCGFSHIPRVEDWPVMPAESISVYLKPANFFLENPGLDVPPPS